MRIANRTAARTTIVHPVRDTVVRFCDILQSARVFVRLDVPVSAVRRSLTCASRNRFVHRALAKEMDFQTCLLACRTLLAFLFQVGENRFDILFLTTRLPTSTVTAVIKTASSLRCCPITHLRSAVWSLRLILFCEAGAVSDKVARSGFNSYREEH